LSPDFPGIRDLNPDEIPLAFAFAPLHHSAEWESGPELDPELIKGFQGQILKTNDLDVPSIVSDNASCKGNWRVGSGSEPRYVK